MNVKMKLSRTTSEVTRRGVFSFIQEFKEELRKVTWTTKSELALCTKIIVGSTFVFGFGIYFSDLVINGALDGVRYIMHFIFG